MLLRNKKRSILSAEVLPLGLMKSRVRKKETMRKRAENLRLSRLIYLHLSNLDRRNTLLTQNITLNLENQDLEVDRIAILREAKFLQTKVPR
jgi:hypothetical protein